MKVCQRKTIDTEKMSSVGDTACADLSEKKDNEKKKRSRVKQLLSDVKKQVEFWFGDVNLHKDRFMKSIIEQSRDGYIDIAVLTTFNRMKNLTADVKLIARALKNSTIVEVNDEGTRIRRKEPLGETPKDVDSRTVYVELLPKTVTHIWLERVFSKCGHVVYISIPRYKSTRHSKGFAFVEFETQEQAQKAVEMLNNPPEDAPRKPGIFPKTCRKKAVPFDAVTQDNDEDGKKKKTELKNSTSEETGSNNMDQDGMLESTVTSEPNLATLTSTVSKKAKKKRLRSQSFEASSGEDQFEMSSKMRKVEEEKSELKDLSSENKDEELNSLKKKDDSVLKAKRKRKKKLKERLKVGEEVIPLRVLSKKEWLDLKQEYLTLQKRCMAHLKQSVFQINQKPTNYHIVKLKEDDTNAFYKDTPKKELTSGPEFLSGVIVKISYNQPLPSKRCIKDMLSELSPVAYVDLLDGDTEGHVRFKSSEDAQKVIKARFEFQKKYNWNLELLSGDHERRYWQKILVDRQAKLNTPREKKRGTEKLISKAEKIIIAKAKEASNHIRFDD
ncbi:la-related protein 7 [Danio rerio]|uniref:La-related protein 7 n=1 Tax=Danio rerio TaxID=7955 RepID=LARP7_DANRE|nr:la-related protein 7 [Danio rerio]Q7ZWE3.1 RecName: Full=La-related protein 7; AltName: Full=La ribonucleoprotein domain family member 7 [Danio rerio]AAH49455.1 Zgc:56476 [Danio rerio]|eukprot:NP_956224.1 la-related protein 7 [Danio rerio]